MLITSDGRGRQPEQHRAGTLRYDRPADRWFEALPIGNGRLAAMVYGGIGRERIDLSESTAWSGAPGNADVDPDALPALPQVRELLFAGQTAQAQRRAAQSLLGHPTSFGTNLPLPDVMLDVGQVCGTHPAPEVTGYRRELDLASAIASTDYVQNGASYRREVLASNPHGLVAVRLTCSEPGALGFDLGIETGVMPGTISAQGRTVGFDGHAHESLHSNGEQGVRVMIGARVEAEGGAVTATGDRVRVEGATTATVYIAVATDWRGEHPEHRLAELLERAAADGYDAVRTAHIADHGELMARSSFRLGRGGNPDAVLATDERHRRLAAGQTDDDLLCLYYQYGRYLTIAGSRLNSPLPLALQGQWNDGLASGASWTNDFHLDMNTQQNYWAAEPTGLGECHEPLFALIEQIADTGRQTARDMYGANGWVAHTVTNAWGYTAPGSGAGWGLNVTGGAWIAMHLWDRFEYARDLEFLRNRAYPVLREASRFFLSYLVQDPRNGWLVSGPSNSPENWYVGSDGSHVSVSMGNTVDRVFAEAILRATFDAAGILGVDDALRDEIEKARELLPPFQVGRHGQLQEWLQDVREADPAHRHTSHLCALYPERQISPRRTPELARAAAVTIERRLAAPEWEQVEWVEANCTVYYARLLDGDRALQHYTSLITDTSEANLMSYSAGGVAGAVQNIYSFDGNAGGTAGVAEMLVQSDGDEIELLPALPSAWTEGEITGLRVKGGYALDIRWARGALELARLVVAPGATPKPVTVRYRDDTVEVAPTQGLALAIEHR